MLLIGRRKEPKEELIAFVALVADRKISSIRVTHIKVDLGESGAVDIETYTSCRLVFYHYSLRQCCEIREKRPHVPFVTEL